MPKTSSGTYTTSIDMIGRCTQEHAVSMMETEWKNFTNDSEAEIPWDSFMTVETEDHPGRDVLTRISFTYRWSRSD